MSLHLYGVRYATQSKVGRSVSSVRLWLWLQLGLVGEGTGGVCVGGWVGEEGGGEGLSALSGYIRTYVAQI